MSYLMDRIRIVFYYQDYTRIHAMTDWEYRLYFEHYEYHLVEMRMPHLGPPQFLLVQLDLQIPLSSHHQAVSSLH